MNACYLIPEQNMKILQGKIEKLTRRAVKLGVEPVALKVVKRAEIPVTQHGKKLALYSWVEIVGTAPRMEGFEFMGSIEFMGDIALFQAAGEGKTDLVDSKYWKEPTRNCDHCNTSRYRKNLYIVRNTENGEVMQIGKNCMADYARSKDYAQQLAAYETMLHAVSVFMGDDEEPIYHPGGYGQDDLSNIYTYLNPTAAIIRNCGWMSVSAARKIQEVDEWASVTPTISRLRTFFDPISKKDKEWARSIHVEEQDEEFVKKALTWLENQESNEYIDKVRTIIEYGYCNDKNAGTLISVLGSYHSFLSREAKKTARTPVPVSDERLHIVGEVVKTDVKDTGFGFREVMTIRDDRGFMLWGSIPNTLQGVEVGDRVEFVAKVEVSDKDECFGFFKRPTKALQLSCKVAA